MLAAGALANLWRLVTGRRSEAFAVIGLWGCKPTDKWFDVRFPPIGGKVPNSLHGLACGRNITKPVSGIRVVPKRVHVPGRFTASRLGGGKKLAILGFLKQVLR